MIYIDMVGDFVSSVTWVPLTTVMPRLKKCKVVDRSVIADGAHRADHFDVVASRCRVHTLKLTLRTKRH